MASRTAAKTTAVRTKEQQAADESQRQLLIERLLNAGLTPDQAIAKAKEMHAFIIAGRDEVVDAQGE